MGGDIHLGALRVDKNEMAHKRPRTNSRLVVLATFLVVTGSWLFRGALAPAAPVAAAGTQLPKALPEAESALPRVQSTMRPAPGIPLRSDRDPFRFGGAEAALLTRAPTPALPRSNLSLSSSIDEPPLVLLGVAEDSREGATHRTAVVGGAGEDIWFVTEGEMVTEQYRIDHVGAESAVLVDVRTADKRHLVLR